MFIEYASRNEVCTALSPYKIGDKVILYNQLSNSNGIITAGTEMIVEDIMVAYDIHVPTDIRKDELYKYTIAGENVFIYTLKHEKSNQKVDCFEKDIYKKGLTKEDLNITINTKGKVSKSTFKILSILSTLLLVILDIIFFISNCYDDEYKTVIGIFLLAVVNIIYYVVLYICYLFYYEHTICKKINIHNQYIIHR